MSKPSKEFNWYSVFNDVMERYEDARGLSVRNTAGALYQNLGVGGGKASSTGRNIVKPSWSDFICDVELAARRALTTDEYKFFCAVYVDMEDVGLAADSKEFKNMDNKIQVKVGRELVRRKIYPMGPYFRGKEIKRVA